MRSLSSITLIVAASAGALALATQTIPSCANALAANIPTNEVGATYEPSPHVLSISVRDARFANELAAEELAEGRCVEIANVPGLGRYASETWYWVHSC